MQDEALGAAEGCIRGEMHCEGDRFGGAQGYTLGGWSNREQDKALWGEEVAAGGDVGTLHSGDSVMEVHGRCANLPPSVPWGVCNSCLAEAHPVLLHGELLVSLFFFWGGGGVQWVLPFPSASPDGCCTAGRGWGIPRDQQGSKGPLPIQYFMML